MRIIHSLLRWGGLYLLVLLMIAVSIWEQTLPVISIDHTILLVFILVFFGILINIWIKHNEMNFLVYRSETRKENDQSEQFEPLNEKAHLEKTK